MGNRGVLHDPAGELVREWQVRRWIACRLEWRGRRRPLRRPGRWTELFFLDEATAIAAGHRPCAQCRHADFKRWQAAWARAHPGEEAHADAMDARLHRDRLAPGGGKRVFEALVAELPAGAMVVVDGAPWLVAGGRLRVWTHAGYAATRPIPRRARLPVLTPAAAVATLAAGYEPAETGV